jgi:GNAT superfamily N-acetyltransferase
LAEIRPYRHGDAEGLMPLFRELWSEELVTPVGLVHWLERQPEQAAMRAWVAQEGEELVGFSNSRFRWALEEEGIAGTWTGVLGPHRGQGLGGALCDLAAEHILTLGAHRLESTVR